MLESKSTLACVLVTIGLFAADSALAAPVSFTNRTAWENAISVAIATEDFNGVTPFGFSPGPNAAGLLVFDQTGGSQNRIELGSFGRNVNGTQYFDGSIAGSSGPVDVVFPSQVVAFGADWSTTGTNGTADPENALNITINGMGFAFTSFLAEEATGFVGFVDTVPFTSVRLTSATEQFGMDDASFAAVPEPGSLAFLAIGGLFLLRRRL